MAVLLFTSPAWRSYIKFSSCFGTLSTGQLQRYAERSTLTPRGCWEWRGAATRAGYGVVRIGHRTVYLHHLADALNYGPCPPGIDRHHTCGNRRCWNPDHILRLNRRDHRRATLRQFQQASGG